MNSRADQCKPTSSTMVTQLRSDKGQAPHNEVDTRNCSHTSERPRLQFGTSLAPRICRPTGTVHAPWSHGFAPTRNQLPRTEGGVRNGSRTSNSLAPIWDESRTSNSRQVQVSPGLTGTALHLGHTAPVRNGSSTSDWKEQQERSCTSGSPHP
jgi:hypothetical protein